MNRELIVSLTSYPPRFPYLHLTLKSLIDQSVKPDRIVVWIADDDLDALPQECWAFESEVEFVACADVKSYKKLSFALQRHPDSYIVTADDDVFYHRKWLESLVHEARIGTPDVLCHVAFRFHLADDGSVAKYSEWSRDVQDAYSRRSSEDLVAIGVGGVLYPPGALSAEAADVELSQRICPHGDDLWYFAMARLKGTRVRKVGPRLKAVLWDGSQDAGLFKFNVPFGNDRSVANLVARYGMSLFEAGQMLR
nr:glycosyltransferase family A protein [Stakelama flava]